MTGGVLDPFLFAVPPADCSREDVLRFARAITGWHVYLDRYEFEFCVSERLMQALVRADAFPGAEALGDRLARRGIDEFDATTLLTVFSWFYNRQQFLEDRCGISDVLAGDAGPTFEPEWVLNRLPPQLGDVLQHSLLLCATAFAGHRCERGGIILFSAARQQGRATHVRVSAQIDYCEDRSDGTGSAWEAPRGVDESIPLAFLPDEILDHVSIMEVWARTDLVLLWGHRHALPDSDRTRWPLTMPRVHAEFSPSIATHSLDENEMAGLFKTVALLACGRGPEIPGLELHPLRQGGPGGPPIVRRRDGARAMRMQIEQHGRGLQVHYWHLGGTQVELAALRSHNDYSIPE